MVLSTVINCPASQLYDSRNNPIAGQDPLLEMIAGNIPGRAHDRRAGFNPSLNTSTFETVWSASSRIAFLSAAETMDIVSTDAGDNPTGAGSRTVRVEGVGENFEEVTEDVVLNGLTPVTTTQPFWVINTMTHLTAGANKKNLGVLTATATTAGTLQAHIPIGYGTTQHVFFAIPVEKAAVITSLELLGTKTSGGSKFVVSTQAIVHDLLGGGGLQTTIFEEAFDTSVGNRTVDNTTRGGITEGGRVLELIAIADTMTAAVFARSSFTLMDNDTRLPILFP